jgi:uncharacterized membrane protein YdbT with pleckstrin-like domain
LKMNTTNIFVRVLFPGLTVALQAAEAEAYASRVEAALASEEAAYWAARAASAEAALQAAEERAEAASEEADRWMEVAASCGDPIARLKWLGY